MAEFKRDVKIANILTAIFLHQHDFTKAKRLLKRAAILTSKLFIDSQKSNMQEIGYAILKAKVDFCFPCNVMACSGPESQNKLVEEGLNDWKNANNLLRRHEESNSHQQHLIELLMHKKASEPNRRRTKVLKCSYRANNRGC